MQWTHKIFYGLENMNDTMFLRNKVFHDEQKFTEQIDETDAVSFHYVLYDGENPIATGRSFPYRDGIYKIGRVCVLPEYRGKNIGKALMEQIERHLCENGVQKMQLSAQEHAIGFYLKLGFCTISDFYMDEHCPHKDMLKTIG